MAKQNKPAIRFKGFTDAWEQRKFSDLYAPLVERNSDLLPYNKTLSVATMTYKTDGNGAADSSLANYKRLRTGDIAFEGHTSKSFRYGRFVLNDVGDGIMSPRFSALRPLAQMPTNFWKYYIHYEPIMRKILVASTKAGTMMNELVIDEFLKSSVLVPSIEEQTRIGSILKNIDNLITLHQRKFDKLQVLKKAMLEKMFPKNGSSVPEIRFKGFTDAWEQRKFSDITFPAGEKNKENQPLESYSITNESGFVPQDEKFENGGTMREADKRMYYIVSPNSFAYNPARINVGSIGYQDTGKSVIVSSLYEVFKTSDDVDDRLLWHWFKSPDFQKLIMQLQEGGVRLYFYYDKLCMGQVPLPSLEEQRKIGKLFDTLDHLITLHQRELEKLQNIKKSMLEKMFV